MRRPPDTIILCLMVALVLGVLVGLLLASAAEATTLWTVDYLVRGDVSTLTAFYGPGAYEFLWEPDYVAVYVTEVGATRYLGIYGAPYGAWPEAIVPAEIPPIVFPPGTDEAVAVPWENDRGPLALSPTAVPEPGAGALLAAGALAAGLMLARRARRGR